MAAADKRATEPSVPLGNIEVTTRNFFDRHLDLVYRYEISIECIETKHSVIVPYNMYKVLTECLQRQIHILEKKLNLRYFV